MVSVVPIAAPIPESARRTPLTLAGALLAVALMLGAGSALALPRHAPVPGGVAVLKLGPAATAMPAVSFGALPQPVLRERGQWVALIGIPLDSPA
ncbi:MAG TPA: hypothetical protein VFY24_01045, partial [Azospira sp.]|nr:hypothetical protein [Azospira sp.]